MSPVITRLLHTLRRRPAHPNDASARAPACRAAAPSGHDPALDLLVERVHYAFNGWDYSREDLALLVHETLWQIGHLVRQGATVEVPQVGTIRRFATPGGYRVDFIPDPDLLEAVDA